MPPVKTVRRAKQKTSLSAYMAAALPTNKHRNTTNKKYFLPPRSK